MDNISKIVNEEVRKYTKSVMNEGLGEHLDVAHCAYNELLNVFQTYICARNEDAGLRGSRVEASLRRGLSALHKQYDRELRMERKRRR